MLIASMFQISLSRYFNVSAVCFNPSLSQGSPVSGEKSVNVYYHHYSSNPINL